MRCFQIIKKSICDPSEEVDILLRHGHHPHIVKLFDVYEDETHVNLVLEYCRGGEMLDRCVDSFDHLISGPSLLRNGL